jgi:hypothetical protein
MAAIIEHENGEMPYTQQELLTAAAAGGWQV